MLWCACGGCACGVEARDVSLGSGELESEREDAEPESRRRRPLSVPPPGVLGVLSPPARSPLAYQR